MMEDRAKLPKALLIILLGFAAYAVYSAMPHRIAMRKARATQQSMAAVSAVIDMYADEHFEYPGPTEGFISITELRRLLDPEPSHFPVRDAWGGPILYWSDGAGYMLASFGADGRAEFSYEDYVLPYEPVTRGRMNTDPEQDIILVCGGVWQGPVVGDRVHGRFTMANLRSIGTAIESYSIDNSIYPGFSSSLVDVQALEPYLTPIYIRTLPLEDSWGYSFQYWSDRHAYTVISVGSDGLADAPYEQWSAEDFASHAGGEVMEPRLDILFTRGRFTQWPAVAGEGTCP
jgi:type II secretory pathway pseudopilin PulG